MSQGIWTVVIRQNSDIATSPLRNRIACIGGTPASSATRAHCAETPRVGQHLIMQACDRFAWIQLRLAMEGTQHRKRQLFPVDDAPAQAIRVKQRAHGVRTDAVARERAGEESEDPIGRAVALQDVPGAIDHQRGIRFLLAQDEIERVIQLIELGHAQISFSV